MPLTGMGSSALRELRVAVMVGSVLSNETLSEVTLV